MALIIIKTSVHTRLYSVRGRSKQNKIIVVGFYFFSVIMLHF